MLIEALIFLAATGSIVVRCTLVSLPALNVVTNDGASPAITTHTAEFPRCRPSSPGIEELNRLLEKRARDSAGYDDASRELRDHPGRRSAVSGGDAISGECQLPFQLGSVLSFRCRSFGMDRLRSGSAPWAVNVEIGAKVHELELQDLLESGVESRFWLLVRRDLEKQEVLDAEGVVESETGPLTGSTPAFNITSEGLLLDFGNHFSRQYVTVVLPYRSLRGILKARFIPQESPPN